MSVTSATSDSTVSDPHPCPRCGQRFLRRCRRAGVVDAILSRLHVYPFRCQVCQLRFHAVQWGKRYRRSAIDRRELERVRVQLGATLALKGREAAGHVTELSLRGCTVKTAASAVRGTSLKLQMHPAPRSAPIVIDAAVVRSASQGALALEFLSVRPAEAAKIRSRVQETLAQAE